MVTADGQIQFTLEPAAPLPAIDVRLRRFGARWVAEVGGGQPNVALAGTPREALIAALEPLGERAVRLLMADLSLLEPSCHIIELDRAAV
jgi:hypothetical protein